MTLSGLGSTPDSGKARVAELVDACDLKSHPFWVLVQARLWALVQSIFFLRKSRMFNKSRYSRNRQTTRVAFYLSLLVNILVILGVFTLFYKILFKLALLWWPFFALLGSFFLGSFIRTQIFSKIVVWLKNIFKH